MTSSESMRALMSYQAGGVFEEVGSPRRAPGAGEVLVRIHAEPGRTKGKIVVEVCE